MISQTTPAGISPRAARGRPRPRSGRSAASTPPRRARSGKMWPGWTRSRGPDDGVDGDLDRVRAVVRRDAGRDALARLDRDGERGAERRLVLVGHLAQPELVAALLGQAEADEPARVRDHEVDGLGRRELGRDRQVALVLAVLVVDDDDEAAGADVLDRLLDGGERALGARVSGHRHGGMLPGAHRGRRAGEPLDVLGEHVDLEVDEVARRELARASSPRACAGSAPPRSPSSSSAATVKRDAVDGDRALLDAVAEQLGLELDPHAHAVALGRRPRRRVPVPSTWPCTWWPPSGSPARSAGSTLTRPPNDFTRETVSGTTSKASRPGSDLDDGQADAVDRDRVAELGRGRRLDHEPAVVERRDLSRLPGRAR